MKNAYEIRGEMTAIFLHYKGTRHETIIDTIDLFKAQEYPNTWFMLYSADINDFYVAGRVVISGKAKHIKLHRLLMDTPNNMVVDHINHKTLDNRRSVNLRNVTDNQNKQNRSHKNGIRGVRFDRKIRKWTVTVNVNKEALNFGYHDSYDEALDISKRARAKYQPFSLEATQIITDDDILPLKKKNADKLSGVKGVTWHEYSEKWRVRTIVNGKMTIIGSYENLTNAIQILREHKNKQPS